MTRLRADDLAQLKVDIELFPMPKSDFVLNDQGEKVPPRFDVRKFYGDVLTADQDDLGFADDLLGIDGAQSRIFELMRRIR